MNYSFFPQPRHKLRAKLKFANNYHQKHNCVSTSTLLAVKDALGSCHTSNFQVRNS